MAGGAGANPSWVNGWTELATLNATSGSSVTMGGLPADYDFHFNFWYEASAIGRLFINVSDDGGVNWSNASGDNITFYQELEGTGPQVTQSFSNLIGGIYLMGVASEARANYVASGWMSLQRHDDEMTIFGRGMGESSTANHYTADVAGRIKAHANNIDTLKFALTSASGTFINLQVTLYGRPRGI